MTPERRKLFRFGPGFYQVSPKLVYRNGSSRPKNLGDIKGSIVVPAGSTGEDLMKELAKQIPQPEWSTNRDTDVEELLKQVADGKVDYTVVQEHHTQARTQRYYPELTEGLTLASKQTSGLGHDQAARRQPLRQHHRLLRSALHGWRHRQARRKVLRPRAELRLRRHPYLPATGQEPAAQYQALSTHAKDIDWRLLAAISYQESHWDGQHLLSGLRDDGLYRFHRQRDGK